MYIITHQKSKFLLFTFMLLGLSILFLPSTATQAATHTVTNLNDAGPGSFRDAVENALDGDVIEVSVTGTITLTQYVNVTADITINGSGVNTLTLTTSHDGSPVLYIRPTATVTINNLTIADSDNLAGSLTGGVGGGLINEGNLTLQNIVMRNNFSGDGGAIFNTGTVRIYDSLFDTNSTLSAGAVIYSYSFGGTIEIQRTEMVQNFGPNIINNDGAGFMSIIDSSIINNDASFRIIEQHGGH